MNESPRFFTPGNAVAALAILLGVALVLVRASQPAGAPETEPEPDSLVLLELQTKLLAGVARFERDRVLSELEQLSDFQNTPAGRRAVASFEAFVRPPASRTEALKLLPSSKEREPLDAIVAHAITDPASLSAQDQATLLEKMDWFGRLLLASTDAESSRQVEATSMRAMALATLAALVLSGATATGIVLGIAALVHWFQGSLACRLQPVPERSHLYFQSFALYLWGMILFSSLASLLLPDSSPLSLVGSASAICMSVILGVCYPLLRGVSVAQWRADMGWHWGRGFFREVAAGIGAYLAALPLLAAGLSLTLLLQKLEASSSGKPASPISHPIYNLIPEASPPALLLLFLVASLLAPLVEEVMFRGAFYGSLRGFLGRPLSLLLMSFIFAAIHPQGIYAIPSLMAVAISFGIMREWRSSLVAGVVTHGLHNGALLLGVITLLG